MLNLKEQTGRKAEAGNAVIGILVILVILAVGAVAYVTTMDKDESSATNKSEIANAQDANAAPEQENDVAEADATPPVEIKPGNPTVAKLKGQEIKRADVIQFIQTLGPQAAQMPIDQLFPMALDQLIATQIINEKVKKVNLDDDPAVKAEMKAVKEQIVRKVFVEKEVAKAITEDKLKAAYNKYVLNFPEIPERKSRHILVNDEALAKDLVKQVNDGGNFAALAEEYSTDATKENGGELGFISEQDQVIPEYKEAVFATKLGTMPQAPVKSEFGYHIIEVTEERMRPPAPFEEAQPFLAGQLRNEVLGEVLEKWRETAGTEVYDINGEPIKQAEANVEAEAGTEPSAEPAAGENPEAAPAE